MHISLGEIERGFAENSAKPAEPAKPLCTRRDLLHQLREHFARIKVQHTREVNKFHDIDSPLANLDAGDDGLRGFEPRRDVVLRELERFTGGDEGGAKGAVAAAAKGLQCGAPIYESTHI